MKFKMDWTVFMPIVAVVVFGITIAMPNNVLLTPVSYTHSPSPRD